MIKADLAAKFLQLTASTVSEDDLLAEIASLLSEICDQNVCNIFLVEPGGSLILRASTFSPEYLYRCKLGKDVGLTGRVAKDRTPIYLPEKANLHPKSVVFPGLEHLPFESCAILPMISFDHLRGVCVLSSADSWAFTDESKKTIEAAVELGTLAHLTYRHLYHLKTDESRIGAVTEVTRTISESPYLEEILQLLVNMTAQQFNYRVCTVRLLDEERGELVLRATQSKDKAYQSKRAIKLGESIAGKAIHQKQPILVFDVQHDPDYIGHDLAREQGLLSMICLPLLIHDKAVGVISCYTAEQRNFMPDEIAALETIAQQAAISIENAKLQVRSTLMQEMHHRVKNNLQQVASLLRLQMRHGQYKSLEEALNDSLSRILAISAVHDLLSREDLDHVGVASLARTLIQHQRDSFSLPDRHIRFSVEGEDLHLNTMQATQIALILNELIQNAVEHGYRISTEGDIIVSFQRENDELTLKVVNSGDLLPEHFQVEDNRNLGLQIVDSLVRALGGSFHLENSPPQVIAEVRFRVLGGE